MWGYVIVLTIVVYAWYKKSNQEPTTTTGNNDSTPPTTHTENTESIVIDVRSTSPPVAVTPVFTPSPKTGRIWTPDPPTVVVDYVIEQQKSDRTERDPLVSVDQHLQHLFGREVSCRTTPTHRRQTVRTLIYDYISSYVDKSMYDERILYIAMPIVDACLERLVYPNAYMQQVAIVCMYIALKFDNQIRGRQFYKRFPKVASSGALADLDAEIFVNFAHRVLHLPTIHDFFEHFSLSLTALQRSRALFFVESSYRSMDLLRSYPASKLAALAVYLAVEKQWTERLSLVTRLTKDQLEPCSAYVYASAQDTSTYTFKRFRERAKLDLLFDDHGSTKV